MEENKDYVKNQKRFFLVQKLGRLCEVNVVCQIEDQESLSQTLSDVVLARQIIRLNFFISYNLTLSRMMNRFEKFKMEFVIERGFITEDVSNF